MRKCVTITGTDNRPGQAEGECAVSVFKVGETSYRERYKFCGKTSCRLCSAGTGHLVFERYVPSAEKGQRGHWVHEGSERPFGKADVHICENDGCTNTVSRLGQKYCSAKCRVAGNRKAKV